MLLKVFIGYPRNETILPQTIFTWKYPMVNFPRLWYCQPQHYTDYHDLFKLKRLRSNLSITCNKQLTSKLVKNCSYVLRIIGYRIHKQYLAEAV